MDRLFSSLGDVAIDPRVGGGDSFCDRLNNRFTVFLLIMFALLVTGKVFVSEPIACWAPSHFTSSHVEYANKRKKYPRQTDTKSQSLLEGVFASFQNSHLGYGDSISDQLNGFFTSFILLIFGFMVTVKHFVSDPISCWCPSHFTESHVNYTNKVCWTTNTYFLPFSEEIPAEGEDREMISYYQWVALILSCQAVLFYLPRPMWRLFNKKSGIAVCTITDAAIECQRKTDPDDRDKIIRYMAKHMGRFLLELHYEIQMAGKCKTFLLKVYGNYLVILYFFVKCIYIANVIGQLYLLDAFLGTDYHYYGWEIMRNMAMGVEWQSSKRFPRVTLCDFKIRVLGNIHRYTVQCSLPMNLFNEIIFIFIWFWFVFVAAATVGSLILWFIWALNIRGSKKEIVSRLIAMEELTHIKEQLRKEKGCINAFVTTFLRRDGCFILRMVQKNASDIIAAELIVHLWNFYRDHNKQFRRMSSVDHDMFNDVLDMDEDGDGDGNNIL